jgi:hypothetical protein
MTTCGEVAQRFAQEAGKPTPRFLRPRANVLVNPYDDRVLCSYGTHFTLAKIMLDTDGGRSWWLLNGDTYSVSTTRHQGYIRQACQRTGLPMLIVPFSVLAEAGIDHDSIMPVGIEDDQFVTHTHYADSFDDISEQDRYFARLLPDGRWTWHTRLHVLGASVFRATYRTTVEVGDERRTITRVAYFLSAFDEQETRPHYFLCELPDGAAPTTVAEAFHALKPAEVIRVETAGLTCTRQGDVFAAPTTLTTRQVSRLGSKRERGPRVLGLSHRATEVVVADDGTTYARGVLHHAPWESWRSPEHKRQAIGDRRTWHVLVKNTVPVDLDGNNRAWSRGGNVD